MLTNNQLYPPNNVNEIFNERYELLIYSLRDGYCFKAELPTEQIGNGEYTNYEIPIYLQKDSVRPKPNLKHGKY